MAYIKTPLITSGVYESACREWFIGIDFLKNKLQKRIKVNTICLGKPLACPLL